MSPGDELIGTMFQRNEVVFRQGEPGDTFYIIQSGAVEVSKCENQKKMVLAVLKKGDFFGEMALLDNRPRSATAITLSRSRLLPLTQASLRKRIERDPGVVLHLLRTFSERIEQTNRLLRERVEGNMALMLSLKNCRERQEKRPSLNEYSKKLAESEDSVEEEYLSKLTGFFTEGEYTSYEPGGVIFHQGERGDTMYIIIEGSVEITQGLEGGKYVLARLGLNDYFGEMALITCHPRTATALATERTLLLPIEREEFFRRVRKEPELALSLLRVMVLRLRRTLLAVTQPKEHVAFVRRKIAPMIKKVDLIRVSFVSLSSCSGCIIGLFEDQKELKTLIQGTNIVYGSMLMDQEKIPEADIALVDGAVRMKEDEEKLLEVRSKSRYLIAWGTCAVYGGIPALANQYEIEDLIEESYGYAQDPFEYYLSGDKDIRKITYQDNNMALLRKAGELDDLVKVDCSIPGCPPKASLLMCLLKEFSSEQKIPDTRTIVCTECKRKVLKDPEKEIRVFPRRDVDRNHCFTSRGTLCMGFVTRGGCMADCPNGGLPCWGCRGPSAVALRKMTGGESFEQVLLKSLKQRFRLSDDLITDAVKSIRRRGNSSLCFGNNFLVDSSRLR